MRIDKLVWLAICLGCFLLSSVVVAYYCQWRMYTIRAINYYNCYASVDRYYTVYFNVLNVYKNHHLITRPVSCHILNNGDRVRLILRRKRCCFGRDDYDVVVYPPVFSSPY